VDSPTYILITFVVISVAIAVILTVIESKLKKKIESEKDKKEIVYINELNKIENTKASSARKLNLINRLVKRLFRESFGIDSNLSYSEVIEEFRKRKETQIVKFCELMLSTYYSGEQINPEKIDLIMKKLGEILEKKFLSNEEKKEEEDSKKPLAERIEEFSVYKKQAEIMLRKIASDKTLMNSLKKDNIFRENLRKWAEINPKAASDLSKSASYLREAHKIFRSIFHRVYKNGTEVQKIKLTDLANKWKEEQGEVLIKSDNPFQKQIMELKLIDKYFNKFKDILSQRF
jgi:hypothetical protein